MPNWCPAACPACCARGRTAHPRCRSSNRNAPTRHRRSSAFPSPRCWPSSPSPTTHAECLKRSAAVIEPTPTSRQRPVAAKGHCRRARSRRCCDVSSPTNKSWPLTSRWPFHQVNRRCIASRTAICGSTSRSCAMRRTSSGVAVPTRRSDSSGAAGPPGAAGRSSRWCANHWNWLLWTVRCPGQRSRRWVAGGTDSSTRRSTWWEPIAARSLANCSSSVRSSGWPARSTTMTWRDCETP